MTLPEAIEFARAHHPRLAVARSEIDARRAQSAVPRARWLPRIGTTVQAIVGSNNSSATDWLGSGGAVELPRISGTAYLQRSSQIDWAPYMNTTVAVGLEQRIFDFGRVAAEQAFDDAQVEVSRYREAQLLLLVELAVREAYYATLAAGSIVTAADGAVTRARVHRDHARAWVGQGLRPQIELDRSEADLSRFEVGRIRALGGLEIARAVFAEAVGIDAPGLDIAGEAPLPPELPPLVRPVSYALVVRP